MASKLREKLNKLKQDNQGAAIIVAVVAIAFIGMLIAMLTYMAYYNYLMKHVDKQSKDNFYSAEYALEVINAGLQKDISDSMSEAYVNATKTTVENQDPQAVNISFQSKYLTSLKNKIKQTSPTPSDTRYQLSHLTDMWTKAGLTLAPAAGLEGAWLESSDNLISTSAAADYLTMHNLRIVYTDKRGYVSIIETDIRLKVPNMDFAQSIGNLNVEDYSLIANVSVINDSQNNDTVPAFSIEGGLSKGSVNTKISGSIYGGKDGIYVGSAAGIELIKDPNDENAGLVDQEYKLIAGSINVTNTLTNGKGVQLHEKYSTFVDDINITSAKFVGDGKMYVGDDMDIAGKSSTVTLKGTYLGYGNENTSASGSSSILINGAKTTLNFRDLKTLKLSGHAYVGAKRYDADKDRLKMLGIAELAAETDGENFSEYTADQIAAKMLAASDPDSDKIEMDMGEYLGVMDSDQYATWLGNTQNAALAQGEEYNAIPRNDSDVLTGESISVKANQLFYMVPSDCIGFIRGTSVQKYARNPMTYDEYKNLCNDFNYDEFVKLNDDGRTYKHPEYASIRSTYLLTHTLPAGEEVPKEEINPDKVPIELHTYEPYRLSELWSKLGSPSYTAKARPVYRRVNGTVMVYLYLDFSSDEILANQFFRSYYDYSPESVSTYVNSYIDSLTWGRNIEDLTLAGNAFRMNGRNVVLVNDTMDDPVKYAKIITDQEELTDKYQALMHILKDDSKVMSSTQAVTDVFDNIVDESSLTRINNITGREFLEDGIFAYVGKSNVVYPSDACPNEADKKTAVIITSGDVYLRADYDGLVMAGGNIYICGGCNQITYNPEKVLKALRIAYDDFGTTVHVYDAFGASGALSYGIGSSTASGDSIAVSDLITYQNWKKE